MKAPIKLLLGAIKDLEKAYQKTAKVSKSKSIRGFDIEDLKTISKQIKDKINSLEGFLDPDIALQRSKELTEYFKERKKSKRKLKNARIFAIEKEKKKTKKRKTK